MASVLPVIGFYLQPAVGGRKLDVDFWRDFARIDNVVAVKMAPFNRYQTLDVVRGVIESGRAREITLYTGNDDNILADLLTGYTLSDGLKDKIAKGERNPDAIKATTALRRFVEPRDVAEAALFLCSERAGAITGVTLPIDAGWLVQAPYAHYLRGNPIRG